MKSRAKKIKIGQVGPGR